MTKDTETEVVLLNINSILNKHFGHLKEIKKNIIPTEINQYGYIEIILQKPVGDKDSPRIDSSTRNSPVVNREIARPISFGAVSRILANGGPNELGFILNEALEYFKTSLPKNHLDPLSLYYGKNVLNFYITFNEDRFCYELLLKTNCIKASEFITYV